MSTEDPQGFAMIPRWLLHDEKVSMHAKLVYITLSSHADRHGRSWPSLARLVKITGYSKSSVQRGLRELTELGVVVRSARTRKTGGQSTNLYVLSTGDAGPVDDLVDN